MKFKLEEGTRGAFTSKKFVDEDGRSELGNGGVSLFS